MYILVIKFIHKNTGTLSFHQSHSLRAALWLSGRQHTPQCFHVSIYEMGFTSLQCLQGTRLKKTKFITLPLLIEPTVNSEWETNTSSLFTLGSAKKCEFELHYCFYTRGYAWLWTSSSKQIQISTQWHLPSWRNRPLSSKFSVREGSTRVWAENIWRHGEDPGTPSAWGAPTCSESLDTRVLK